MRDPIKVLKSLETPDHVKRYFQRRSVYEVLESLRTDTPLHIQFEQYAQYEQERQKALEIRKIRKMQRKNSATKVLAASVAVAIAGLTLTPVTSFAATDDMIPIETEKLPEAPLKRHEKREKRKFEEKTIKTEKESIHKWDEVPLKKKKREKPKFEEKTIEIEKEPIHKWDEAPLKKKKREKLKHEERTQNRTKESLQKLPEIDEMPLKHEKKQNKEVVAAETQQDKKNDSLASNNVNPVKQESIVLASTNSQANNINDISNFADDTSDLTSKNKSNITIESDTNDTGTSVMAATNTNSQTKEASTPAKQQSDTQNNQQNNQQTQMNQEKVSYYEVSRGDTLWDIAERYYRDGERWIDIWEENKDMLIKRDERNKTDHGHWIYPGQTLKINLE